ncbi:hypothetical protein [Nakamurella deserti]|uniref:hypothetical protein n=1 Tax=Nakamurella deserti TaxID=2164074 RepID=UPI000DBE4C39|nr:hypothetical protein [Nakamurella deserti]
MGLFRSRGATPAATGPATVVPAPVQRAAWRDLPPLPPVAPMPPIAARDPFVRSLATSHDPSFLAPLGHALDAGGPIGTVGGLTSVPVPRHIPTGPEPAVAPARSVSSSVQRLVALPQLRFGADPAPSAADDPAPSAGTPAPAPGAADADPVASTGAAEAGPVATLPTATPPVEPVDASEGGRSWSVTDSVRAVAPVPMQRSAAPPVADRTPARPLIDAPAVTVLPLLNLEPLPLPTVPRDTPETSLTPSPSAGSAGAVTVARSAEVTVPTGPATGTAGPGRDQLGSAFADAPLVGHTPVVLPPASTVQRSGELPAAAEVPRPGTGREEVQRSGAVQEPVGGAPPTRTGDAVAVPVQRRSALSDPSLPVAATDPRRAAGPTPVAPGAPLTVARAVVPPTPPTATVSPSAESPTVSPAEFPTVSSSAGSPTVSPSTEFPTVSSSAGSPTVSSSMEFPTVSSSAGSPTVSSSREFPTVSSPSGVPRATSSPTVPPEADVPPAVPPGRSAVETVRGDSPTVLPAAAAPPQPVAPLVGLSHLMRALDRSAGGPRPESPPNPTATAWDPPVPGAAAPPRRGLGPPVARVPDVQRTVHEPGTTPSVPQRASGRASSTASTSGPPAPSRAHGDEFAERADVTPPDRPGPAAPPLPPLSAVQRIPAMPVATAAPPDLPSVRGSTPAPTPTTTVPPASSAPGPTPAPSTAAVAPAAVGPVVRLQRVPSDPASPVSPLTVPLLGAHPPLATAAGAPEIVIPDTPATPVTWATDTATSGPAAAVGTTAITAITAPPVPLQRATPATAPAPPPGSAPHLETMWHLPAPAAGTALFLQRVVAPGAAAVARGIARPDGPASVVFAPPTTDRPTPPPPGVSVPLVQRASDGAPPDGPAPVVARDGAAPEPGAAAAPAGGAAGGGSAATAAPAALPTDLDELARRLFDPLTARLRAELWLDRERAGLSLDLHR